MTASTWIGGGTNKASDANDWSSGTAPQPGDALSINSGTMNVAGYALAGDTLTADNNAQAPIQINASHHAHIDLDLTDEVTVDLSVHGRMSLELHQSYPSTLHTQGGTIRFLSGSKINGSQTIFDSNLTGDATVDVSGSGGAGALVTFDGAVG
jgi:hypothetical protein